MNDLSANINRNGINKNNVEIIEQYGKDIIEGLSSYRRYTAAEIQGLARGGELHAEASLIAGREINAGSTESTFVVESQDESADRQEAEIEAYARERGVWHENTWTYLNDKYGFPINSGHESYVFDNGVTVVKTSNIFQYRDLQDAFDSITLNNTEFPEAAIDVLGFGLGRDGEINIIKEQQYIEEGPRQITQQEIDEFLLSKDYEKDTELFLEGRYLNTKTGRRMNDIKPKNVILTPDGRIVPIDVIAHLNTPEFGGGRQTQNELEYNTEKNI